MMVIQKITVPPGTSLMQEQCWGNTQEMVEESVEYWIGENAHFILVHEQDLGMESVYKQSLRFVMAAGSRLHYFPIMRGAGTSTLQIQLILDNKAEAVVQGAYAISGEQKCVLSTRQEHVGPDSRSTLSINGIAAGKADINYKGVIAVQHQAPRVYASQENKTILLSDQAYACSVPSLEVLQSDVHCAHGSAVGPLQKELIYYLQARGIPVARAKRLLLESFFYQTLSTFNNEKERKRLIDLLLAKANVEQK